MTSAYAADPVFEANGQQISYLIQRVHNRELALPDFQRSFVWDSRRTLELLRSVMCRFPAGTLLFWKQADANSGFAQREVAGAPTLEGHTPDELVLDGQQRITALYRVMTNVGDERYFVRLNAFIDEFGQVKKTYEIDFDKALFLIDTSVKKHQDPQDEEWQFGHSAFPLGSIEDFPAWLDRFARATTVNRDVEDHLKASLRKVYDTFLVPLRSYGFPVVTLPAKTPLEAVCNIFETLNRSGKPLGAFELLTARFYPKGLNLRDLWLAATSEYSVLNDFDVEPYDVLQAISLRVRNSAQRSDVLAKLDASDVEQHWTPVVSGMASVLNDMQSEYGVMHKKWLPYGMLLVPMAAAYPEIKAMKPLERGHALVRLRQYFWCTTFMTNFDQGANSQAGADYVKLKAWLPGESPEAPEAVQHFDFAESALRAAGVRRKALHAGVMAVTIMAGRAKDFHTGQTITAAKAAERSIDSHHVFPKAYLKSSDAELILNRALIDSETNRVIGKKPPSEYLAAMRDSYGAEKLADVLDSHAIATGADSGLENDNYSRFLDQRAEQIIEFIEAATGKRVTRTTEEEA